MNSIYNIAGHLFNFAGDGPLGSPSRSPLKKVLSDVICVVKGLPYES